jgi:argininosuccinate lyase
LADCRRRVNVCGLGAAACAGTSLPIDRHWTAAELGFEDVAANSIDVSSDRDFVLESAFVLALIATHLSGWAEEWILWSTVEFSFIKLPQQFCTGSSIMPQKINPDTLELTRGKAARVIGDLQTLFVLVKGLPLAYNRDLQEDKPAIFDAFDTVQAAVDLAAPIVEGAELNRPSIAARLERGHLDATTLMEHLIKKGLPQRTAHHLVGSLVAVANEHEITLAELSLEQLQGVHPELDESLKNALGVAQAVKAYQSYGSSNPDRVREQVRRWTTQLQ